MPRSSKPATDEVVRAIREAAKDIDWGQVVANGGPPCFNVESGKFCLRAERWPGHGVDHPYISLEHCLQIVAPASQPRHKASGTKGTK